MPRTRKVTKKSGVNFTEHVLHDAAEMYTFDADHDIWTDVEEDWEVEGCFVRLYPPAGTAEVVVEHLVHLLMDNGASAVKIMPTPVEEVPDAPEVTMASPERPIRQVVMERAARTQGVRDHDALTELLTQCMDKAGI